MNWIPLEHITQLEQIKQESLNLPVLIYKHSTRCNISSMALNRLNLMPDFSGGKSYYLDLLAHRDISNRIAEMFNVYHESPQVLIIKNGECIYDASHLEISAGNLKEFIS